ncbi:MAG: hypothetical protein LBR11_08675 [Deltaproteobacteria bacterium]|jgi:nucleoside phosphorylase|nr:hypothetical protein [Deltaproteobacteria bacterium]
MPEPKPDILILTATPRERRGLANALAGLAPRNFSARLIETGPGKVNAALGMGKLLATGPSPPLIIGAGTAGSLEMGLEAGDLVAANETIIADWLEEDDKGRRVGAYGSFHYGPVAAKLPDMLLGCQSPLVTRLLAQLGPEFKRGRILTSDTFVTGRPFKLRQGQLFGCRICDMESGAIAYAANKLEVPWLHLRVVADTMDDSLSDYFRLEKDMTAILGAKTAQVLRLLDENWASFREPGGVIG